MSKEIKCQCKDDGCKMQFNVNNGIEGIIWLDIEDVRVNITQLRELMRSDENDWTTMRVPFALDANGAIELIHQLQEILIYMARGIV